MGLLLPMASKSYFRMSSAFLIFLGLGVVPLLVSLIHPVDGNPMKHYSSCKTSPELIMSAFFNSCKQKRSHGRREMVSGTRPVSEELENPEVWEILFNDIHLMKEWTNTIKKYSPQHPKREPSPRRTKKSVSRWRRTTPATSTSLLFEELELPHENGEIDPIDPQKTDSSSSSEDDVDGKLWKWMVDASRVIGGRDRLRREEYGQVVAAVHKCCHFGCDASDFPC